MRPMRLVSEASTKFILLSPKTALTPIPAVVMAGGDDPYANRLNIGLTLDKVNGGEFPCELIAG